MIYMLHTIIIYNPKFPLFNRKYSRTVDNNRTITTSINIILYYIIVYYKIKIKYL